MKLLKLTLFVFSIILIYGCDNDEEISGNLEITMNLVYDGEPLVMFQDYEYPDGRTINFSRFSLYMSDLKLDQETISDISYHTLTDSHIDKQGAEDGYTFRVNDIPVGEYNTLNFGVGVNETQNAKDPGDFESGTPLAKPAEHWFSWSSFIFLKLEANIDSNGDGNNDFPIALHLGADEAYKIISLDRSIKIDDNETSNTTITFDIYKFLGGNLNTYDVDSNPQIHSLEQKDAVIELANNLPATIN